MHVYSEGEFEWDVPRLWNLSKDLPVEEKGPETFREWVGEEWFGWVVCSFDTFAEHAKRVLEADLSFPVILSAEGSIMDGCHRLVKAWLNEVPVRVVRFPETPAPDRRRDEQSE